MSKPKVIIAGAGPGGLCAALTLQRRGIPSVVLERAPRDRLFADVGGGYDIGTNALKMLDDLGVGDEVRQNGRRMVEVLSMTSTGELFDSMPFPPGLDVAGVLRSTLQRIFLDALKAESETALRCGAKVVGVQNRDDGVEVTLASGEVIEGDVLIGADGVRSGVREAIFGASSPHFCGLTCAWGRTESGAMGDAAALLPPPDRALNIMGKGGIFLAGSPGDDWLWSAFWRTETFERSHGAGAAEATVASNFEEWSPLVKALIANATPGSVVEVGIWDRDPSPTWHQGRTVLIGDAAHPMTPFLGQGANSAMIDAFVLGNALADGTPTTAFELFEARRKRAVEKNVKSARSLAGWMTSESAVTGLAFRSMMRLIPSSLLLKSISSADNVNDVTDLFGRAPPLAA